MVHQELLSIGTQQRTQLSDITSQVQHIISRSGIARGVVTVCSLHTTAGMTVNENADPDVVRDLLWKLEQLVPHTDGYHHMEGNSDSHLKASLVGLSVHIPVDNGRCVLGTWQSVYFCEFDGPRSRRVSITVVGE